MITSEQVAKALREVSKDERLMASPDASALCTYIDAASVLIAYSILRLAEAVEKIHKKE